MRTNIVLNDSLVEEAQRYSNARTKTALVEEALRVLVEVRAKEAKQRSYRERLADLQNTLATKSFRTSAVDIVNADRERP